jgi:hypothetical protein
MGNRHGDHPSVKGKCDGADGSHPGQSFRGFYGLGGRIQDCSHGITQQDAADCHYEQGDQFDDHCNLLEATSRFSGSDVEAIADQEPGKSCGNPPIESPVEAKKRTEINAGYPGENNSKRRVIYKSLEPSKHNRPTLSDKFVIVGNRPAEKGKYNYFAEMETAGKCFEWVKDHIALDEIGIYLKKQEVIDNQELIYESLYDYLSETVEQASPGSGGVIFTPWLHGNRCPFEDPNAAGMFFNIKLETGKTEMIRAVLEGICYHLRWMLECQDKKIKTSETIRFVGGGALSKMTCQILADITGRKIETVPLTKDIGAVGASMLIVVGSGGAKNLEEVSKWIKAKDVYEPNLNHKAIYDKNYSVFKTLYKSNKKNFFILNG